MHQPQKGGRKRQNLSLNIHPELKIGRTDRATSLPSTSLHNNSITCAGMSDDETYEIPLQDQRVFGAGIKRKRVKFIPSSSSSSTPAPSTTPSKSVSDLYMSLVLPHDAPPAEESAQSTPVPITLPTSLADTSTSSDSQVCEICSLPISATSTSAVANTQDDDDDLPLSAYPNTHPRPKSRPHEASLAHQVCLTHSHPPSHLDRTRKGLAYLSSYGWDPDSRLGLGSEGQGIAFPIKTKPKDDKLGIGVVVPKSAEKRKEKLEKLDAGRVRKAYEKERKKGERLREMFYMSDDVERHLRGG